MNKSVLDTMIKNEGRWNMFKYRIFLFFMLASTMSVSASLDTETCSIKKEDSCSDPLKKGKEEKSPLLKTKKEKKIKSKIKKKKSSKDTKRADSNRSQSSQEPL